MAKEAKDGEKILPGRDAFATAESYIQSSIQLAPPHTSHYRLNRIIHTLTIGQRLHLLCILYIVPLKRQLEA